MDDRTLLEAAARAAGYELFWGITDPMIRCHEADFPEKTHNLWNPLTDDGDALRLAVKLAIEVIPYSGAKRTETRPLRGNDAFSEPHGEDPCAATRRAIVRAAASIAAADARSGGEPG